MQQRIKGYKRKENRSEEEEERRRKRFETEDGTITNTEIVNFVQKYLYYLFIQGKLLEVIEENERKKSQQ